MQSIKQFVFLQQETILPLCLGRQKPIAQLAGVIKFSGGFAQILFPHKKMVCSH